MLQSKIGRTLLGVIISLVFVSVTACLGGRGDTDGGAGNDDNGIGVQFVADGGAGATLAITIVDSTISVGDTSGFFVTALDPRGDPLPYIRIFCESEKGIAIIEPSSGGTAFEHTGPDGRMSGVIGGLLPGSFMIECRAPQGFGLVARERVIIRGDVPDGFVGWPGAAGGNLGGGVIVDETPDATAEGTTLSNIVFALGDGSSSQGGPIDLAQISDCDPTDTDPSDAEPWIANTYTITIDNDSNERVFLGSVAITIVGTSGSVVQSLVSEIAPHTSSNLSGQFATISGASKFLAGTSYAFTAGTFPVTFTVTGTTENGNAFTAAGTVSVTFAAVDYCG